MEPIVDVDITGPDAGWLADFARRLVEDRLAACGSVTPGLRSLYRWEGKVQDEFSHLCCLPSLWSPSWFVSTVGGAPLEVVRRSVENRKQAA